MKTTVRLGWLFALILLSWVGVSPCLEPLEAVLDGLKEKYGHLSGLKVHYTREIITRSMSLLGNQVQGDQAEGLIFFKAPHFLRLEQQRPGEETLLTDGTVLWWHIHDKREVHRYDARKFGRELGLLSDIFRGLVGVGERFDGKLLPEKEPHTVRLQLIPVPAWEEIDRIVITLTPDHDIRVVEIHNLLGTITRFKLDRFQEVDGFDSDFFTFKVPEGATVVEQGEM